MITALVVTYQRKELLKECLSALISQTHALDKILVVDNASRDGTHELFDEDGEFHLPQIEYLQLTENIGGAGGFHEGLRHTKKSSPGWIWMMDDDAAPEKDALAHLLQLANPDNIYGSTAISNLQGDTTLCWPIGLDESPQRIYNATDLPEVFETTLLPFLGFFIHSTLIQKIGLPERNYFLSGDDTEYCLRAKVMGIRLFQVRESIIRHPVPERTIFRIPSRDISVMRLPAWKRYYDVRNRILIAKSYYPIRLWTQTLPGILLRWVLMLAEGKDLLQQSGAFLSGLADGFIGRQGARRTPGN